MRRLELHHYILLAMVLGAGIGLPLNWAGDRGYVDASIVATVAEIGEEVGKVFLHLLQMLVVPLIVSSLVTGVTGLGDLRKLGKLGARTLAFYLSTSLLAILTGILMVNLIDPGVGADLGTLEAGARGHSLPETAAEQGSVWSILWRQISGMVPTNPLDAAAQGKMLPTIFFSLCLGVFIALAEHDGAEEETRRGAVVQVRRFFEGLFEVMMRMTLAVVRLAPLGVFGFMLYAAAGKGLGAFIALGWYALTVLLALLVHAGITLMLGVRLVAGRRPRHFLTAMAPALITAFSTASSNGTLPLTMQCVEERAGVDGQVGSFVLPLGATINMDGTALYEAVAVLFIAQAYGLDLDLGEQFVVAMTALLASIGAAGIPHAGAVMMVVVLGAVGLPAQAVGLILAVDRVLDMCRTAVNVWSDSIAAATVARMSGYPVVEPGPRAIPLSVEEGS